MRPGAPADLSLRSVGGPDPCDDAGMKLTAPFLVLALVLVGWASPAAASAPAQRCEGQAPINLFLRYGVSEVRVDGIRCRRAVRVLRRWARGGYAGRGPAGWQCERRRLNDEARRVRCTRGAKRAMRFDVGGG